MNKLMLAAMAIITAVMFTGCGKVVPAGTTVVLRKASGDSIPYTEGVYYKWGRDKAYFVDGKLKSFSKELEILCQDDINMTVSVKWVGSFLTTPQTLDFIVEKVPVTTSTRGDVSGYELSLTQFWSTAMEDIVSSITRNEISDYKTDDIRPNRKLIAAEIKKQILTRLAELGYPVQTSDVLLTNLDYPPEVTEMRKAIKNAELQELKNAAIAKAEVAQHELAAEVALARGKAELVEAECDAEVNRVRTESLTPQILQVKQIEAFVVAAQSGNNTIMMPYEAISSGWSQVMSLNNAIATKK